MSITNSDNEEQVNQFSTINLENIDLTNPRERLQRQIIINGSPTSIEALKVLGIEFSEIQSQTLEHFKNSSTENKHLKPDILISRYNYHEQKRQNYLKLAKEVN